MSKFTKSVRQYKWWILASVALIALFAVVAANATNNPPPPKEAKAVSHSTSKSVSHASNESSSTSSATSGDSSATSGDVSNSVTFEAANIPRHVSSVNLGSLFPSANCMGVANAGISTGIVGIGGGKSYMDPECDKRETARSFMALGYTQEALFILCSTEAARVLARCPFETPAPAEPARCSDAQCEEAIRKTVGEMQRVWKGGADEAGK